MLLETLDRDLGQTCPTVTQEASIAAACGRTVRMRDGRADVNETGDRR